ncbi:MAG: amidase [Promethearchaeota archaeon]
MNKEDICFMSAYELAEKIKRQELTSQEVTEAVIERIKIINPIINAYCTPTFEIARKMAKESDDKIKKGQKLGMLEGVPFSIKDLTETKGVRTTFGCKIFENNVPIEDEVVVRRLKKAGGVLLGKTNAPAFGYKGVTDNLIFGATKNPWNLERTSGGSSGGAASSIASGIGFLAQGSDGGGSIRIPSCFCGVYGLKPSFGRVPHGSMRRTGNLGTLTHKGPIVRFVRDAALMLDAIAGPDDSDRSSLPASGISFLDSLAADKNPRPSKLRIGYTQNLGNFVAIDPEVKKTVDDAVHKFEEFDWSIEEVKINLQQAAKTFNIFWEAGFSYFLKPYLAKWREKMDRGLVQIVEYGKNTISADDIKWAEVQRENIHEEISKQFTEEKYDVLITPTLACTAFGLTAGVPSNIDGKEVTPIDWLPYTYPFNLTGHPAASIPCGWSKEGLPIGMQIIGKRFDDKTVLQVSQAFEDIAPWQNKTPSFTY